MQKIWSVVDLLCQNPHWWSPIISYKYGLNPERRISDTIFMKLIRVISHDNHYSQFLSPFLWTGTRIDSFHWSRKSSLFQIVLISLWISACVGYLSYISHNFWFCWPTYYLKGTKWEVTLTLWNPSCVQESSLARSNVSNGGASHSSSCCELKDGTQFPPGSVTWTPTGQQASDIQIQF
jgi:hypothetical protein